MNRVNQARACIFHVVKHLLESRSTAVIGIGYFLLAVIPARMLHEQANAPAIRGRASGSQRGQIFGVHRQDMIETLKVFHRHFARPER